jgi:hypothetical protein
MEDLRFGWSITDCFWHIVKLFDQSVSRYLGILFKFYFKPKLL